MFGSSNGTATMNNNSFMAHETSPVPLAPGELGEWELKVIVTDINLEKVITVKSDLHIGGVMLKLVEGLEHKMDWSDYALWWPCKNMWLTHTRSTLDQCGLTASAELHFTPMHKILKVQLPDLREMDFRVDFSVKTFNAVVDLCKHLGIRHPEELSFCKPITPNDLKYNYSELHMRKLQHAKNRHNELEGADTNSFVTHRNGEDANGTLNRSSNIPGTPGTPNNTWKSNRSLNGTGSPASPYLDPFSSSMSYDSPDSSQQLNASLCNSPNRPSEGAREKLIRPKSNLEKARMNVGWLDSSKSIMEQGIGGGDMLLLRFKFFSFFDLNPKYDAARINLIFNQAKYSLLNEEVDCTEEEMLMFAALQLQVILQMNQPQSDVQSSNDDDIERALNDLQVTLEGGSQLAPSVPPLSDIVHVPELTGFLKLLKPRRFTLKSFKQYYFVYRDMKLNYYKTSAADELIECIDLRGCESRPDLDLSTKRYGIQLVVPGQNGMTEYLLRCSDEDTYANWLAALKLAAKGMSLADSSYRHEVRAVHSFLSMQRFTKTPVIDPDEIDIRLEDFLAPRFLRGRLRGTKGKQRILEAHVNVKEFSLMESKQQYIKAWQSLPESGISLFLVKHMGHKKEEFLAVSPQKIARMDFHSGDHLKAWTYRAVKAWNVNWGTRHMMIQTEKDDSLTFSCLTADCKVIHEFIGGYIFLSMRNKDANQALNDELFHKLTGGWV